jgi:hypothetical protein
MPKFSSQEAATESEHRDTLEKNINSQTQPNQWPWAAFEAAVKLKWCLELEMSKTGQSSKNSTI